MRRILAAAAIVLFLAGIPMGTASAETHVDRDIKEDTTWTKVGSPYVLLRDIDVHPGVTLTIEPGVFVQGTSSVSLNVFGTVHAAGSMLEPITFEGYSHRQGWDGVAILGDSKEVESDSAVSNARFTDAYIALFVRYATPAISDVTFEGNRTGLYVAHPNTPLTIANNVFLENKVALKGYTRSDITVEMNDFWDNGIALLPGPRHHYDCGPEGDWAIHRNDILRGPEDEFWTDDVHTPPGSAVRPYHVDAEDNWWGVTTNDRAAGRFADGMESNSDDTQQQIDHRPISQSPHTEWTPPGATADPEPESSSTLNDEPYEAFRAPRHGDCLSARSLDELRGVSFGGGPAPEGFEPGTRVMLARDVGNFCYFWNPKTERMEIRDCNRPIWIEVEGEHWRLDITKRLPVGRYFARTGYAMRGLSAIRFTLR